MKKKQKPSWKLPMLIWGSILGVMLILAGLALIINNSSQTGESATALIPLNIASIISGHRTSNQWMIKLPLPAGANPKSSLAPGHSGQYKAQPCHLSGGTVFDLRNIGLINKSNSRPWFRTSWTFKAKNNLSAGKYKVSLEAFDGYKGRRNTRGQRHEQYRVIFQKNGHSVASTGFTHDLKDGVDSAKDTRQVNSSLNIPRFDQIVVQHYAGVHGNTGSPDSVRAVCLKIEPVKAKCGSANGKTYKKVSDIPDKDLCATGEPTFFDNKGDDGTWNWMCENGDSTADCSAKRPIDGKCGLITYLKRIFDSAPTKDLCEQGTPTQVKEIGNDGVRVWSWICKGINGGADSSDCKVYGKPVKTCGNGRLDKGEECDNGGILVKVTPPKYGENDKKVCDGATCRWHILKAPKCGDGNVDEGHEECDEGNNNGQECTPEYGGSCTYCTNTCENKIITGPKCGDGKLDENHEQCDDGNTQNGDGCSATCQFESLGIDLDKTVSKNTIQAGESVTYTYKIKSKSGGRLIDVKLVDNKLGNISCPKSVLNRGEEMTCTKSTTLEADTTNKATVTAIGEISHEGVTDSDTAMVNVIKCGDGVKEGEEECDAGSQNGVIPTVGYEEVKQYCKDDCTVGTVTGGQCGNNKIEGDEECDLGNDNGKECTPDYGKSCTYCTSSCENKTITGPACGDGKKDNGEECDDGNTKSGDGCSATCQIENGKIQIDKQVSKTVVKKGEKVTYTYRVTNTSDVDLHKISVTDNKLGAISCPLDKLDAGKSMQCVKAGVTINDTVKNIAIATALDPNDKVVEDNSNSVTVTLGKEKPKPEPKPEPKKEEKEEDCNSSIGNYVWYDTNGNGIQEDIEEGIEDIKVCAFNGNKKYCDRTNKRGRYKIKDLCKGTYDVVVKDVGGMVQTYDPDGKLDNKTKVRLKNNDKHTKADFGYRGGAPKTGLVTNIIALIGISILITISILAYLRKQGKF